MEDSKSLSHLNLKNLVLMVGDALLEQLLHKFLGRALPFVVGLLKGLAFNICALYLLVKDRQNLAFAGPLQVIENG